MSDIGAALSDTLGGLGSSLGSALTGVGSAFSGGGGSMSQLGSAIGSALSGSQAASPASAADVNAAVNTVIPPTYAAATDLSPPGLGTPQQQADASGGTQSDPIPQGQKQAAGTTAEDKSAADIIRQLIESLRGQEARANPYVTGVGSQGRTSSAPYSEGASSQGEYGRAPLKLGPGKGQPFTPRWSGGEGEPPVDVPSITPPPQLPGGDITVPAEPPTTGGGDTVPGDLGYWGTPGAAEPSAPSAAEQPPEIGPGSAAAAGGLPGLLLRGLSRVNPVLGGLGLAMKTSPAETGAQPPGGYTAPPGYTIAGPSSEALREGEGGLAPEQATPGAEAAATSGTNAPDVRVGKDGSVSKTTVHPDGSKTTVKKTPPPKKKAEPEERPYLQDPIPPGQSRIIRDAAGMGGVPQLLGQLAQLALPLMMGALGGGVGGMMFGGRHGFRGFPFGRGGHGRFGGAQGWSGGHPGGFGSGMWPYHHPGMGWRGYGYHPGGDWRPLHPHYGPYGELWRHGLPYEPPSGGGGVDPIAAALLQAVLGGGQKQQQQQQGQARAPGAEGPWRQPLGSNRWNYSDPPQGEWSGNPWFNTMVGAESSGQNSGAPGQGPAGDNGESFGYFNVKTPTWNQYKAQVPGAEQYSRADQAPYGVQQQVVSLMPISIFGQRTRDILHWKFGDFDERMSVGQLSQAFGGGTQTASQPKTPTGDTKTGKEANSAPAPAPTPTVAPDLSGAQIAQANLARSNRARQAPRPAPPLEDEQRIIDEFNKRYPPPPQPQEPQEYWPSEGNFWGGKSMMA